MHRFRLVTDDLGFITPAVSPTFRLAGNGERRPQDGWRVCCLDRLLAKFELHLGFAKAGIKKASSGSSAQAEIDRLRLKRE